MGKTHSSTRRAFLTSGALLAAPAAATLIPAAAAADEALHARVRRLEDAAAIRELHRCWLRQVNGAAGDALLEPSVRRILPDPAGAPDTVQISADSFGAVGTYDCLVEAETPLSADCTLAQMAHAQGHGMTRSTERRRLQVEYTRSGGDWRVANIAVQTP